MAGLCIGSRSPKTIPRTRVSASTTGTQLTRAWRRNACGCSALGDDVYAYNRLLEKWPPERGWQVVSVADASLELVVLPEKLVSSVAGADAGAGDDNARAKPLPGGSVTLPQETCTSTWALPPGSGRAQEANGEQRSTQNASHGAAPELLALPAAKRPDARLGRVSRDRAGSESTATQKSKRRRQCNGIAEVASPPIGRPTPAAGSLSLWGQRLRRCASSASSRQRKSRKHPVRSTPPRKEPLQAPTPRKKASSPPQAPRKMSGRLCLPAASVPRPAPSVSGRKRSRAPRSRSRRRSRSRSRRDKDHGRDCDTKFAAEASGCKSRRPRHKSEDRRHRSGAASLPSPASRRSAATLTLVPNRHGRLRTRSRSAAERGRLGSNSRDCHHHNARESREAACLQPRVAQAIEWESRHRGMVVPVWVGH